MHIDVVISGLGPVTGFGVGIDPLWQAMVEGRSAIRRIERFDPSGFRSQAAAEVPADFSIRDWVPKSYRKSTKVMCRDVELAVAAAAAAVADAGLVTKGTDPDAAASIDPDRFGCHIGSGLIAADLDELTLALASSRAGEEDRVDLAHWGSTGMQNLTPLWLLKYLPNMLACHVTIVHDCRGPSNTITCTEASSQLSMAESLRVIERGGADACLTGGAESKLNPMAFERQEMSGRLRPTTAAEGDAGALAVRPFDPAADGTLLGEGGGIVVLERADSAAARGVCPYCRVAAVSATQSHWVDARGLGTDEDDRALDDAIELALGRANVAAADVDAIVPFGSGVPSLDRLEAAAIRRVFGERAASIPLVTTIPNVGSCAAGVGAIAVAVAARMIREQVLPARLHSAGLEGLDAAAALSRPADLGTVLVLCTSQGGQNSAAVLRRLEGGAA